MPPEEFMRRIDDMTRKMVEQNTAPSEEHKNLFRQPRESIGKCPRCGGDVFESKQNFHCGNKECRFVMWKADSFYTNRKKELTKTIAIELLKTGKATLKSLYSERTGKTYDAVVLLADTGDKYVNYRFEINGGEKERKVNA